MEHDIKVDENTYADEVEDQQQRWGEEQEQGEEENNMKITNIQKYTNSLQNTKECTHIWREEEVQHLDFINDDIIYEHTTYCTKCNATAEGTEEYDRQQFIMGRSL